MAAAHAGAMAHAGAIGIRNMRMVLAHGRCFCAERVFTVFSFRHRVTAFSVLLRFIEGRVGTCIQIFVKSAAVVV